VVTVEAAMGPMNDPEDSGWPEYRRQVMDAIAGLRQDVQKLDDKLDATRLDVASLKVRAGIAGTVMGFVASGVVYFIDHLLSGRPR
jgi:hypothetical protein